MIIKINNVIIPPSSKKFYLIELLANAMEKNDYINLHDKLYQIMEKNEDIIRLKRISKNS